MNSTALATKNGNSAQLSVAEKVLIQGDLSVLSDSERVSYYQQVCESVGLNPLTQPFNYLKLNGKLTLYALKGCTDQLRQIHNVSIDRPDIQFEEGLCIVSVTARDRNGRTDSDLGVVALGNLQGEARANAILKSITKAKRRVTLSICGLGMLDETEVETIPTAQVGTAAIQSRAVTPTITGPQQKRLFAIAKKNGWDNDSVRSLIDNFGYESTKDIKIDDYDEICAALQVPQEESETVSEVLAEAYEMDG